MALASCALMPWVLKMLLFDKLPGQYLYDSHIVA